MAANLGRNLLDPHHPDCPVFIDLETRSACDLRMWGAWKYAHDPSTRLLTVAWTDDMGKTYHVWFPGLESAPEDFLNTHLPGVIVHFKDGDNVPVALCAVANRPWVGHNAWTFDRLVWSECGDPQPPYWIDTYPLALACGLPGALGQIGEYLWGEGKYAEGKDVMRKHTRCSAALCEPDNVPVGPQMLIGRYNVQDVKLMVDLWPVLCRDCVLPPSEWDVLAAHDASNTRGVRLDRPFVKALKNLTESSKAFALDTIADLTGGALTKANIQSRQKTLAWLQSIGVSFGSSLRRELVAKYIEDNDRHGLEYADEADEADGKPSNCANVALAVKVLELRMQALRVTGGKLDAALETMDEYDRARQMWVYWGAHTGRDANRRIQFQNLPRPKEGVDTWELCELFERTGRLDYDAVKLTLPTDRALYRFLSVDDAASALIRSMVVAGDGQCPPWLWLAAADLANIEARILAWLAGERGLMDAFWSGADPYMAMAERVFGTKDKWPHYPNPKKPGEYLPLKKHPYRQVGKVVVLGSGYQMGVSKFAVYAAANGIDLDAVGTTPVACITAFRSMHPAIAGAEAGEYNGVPYYRGGYWDQLNDAAVMAVERNGIVPVGPVDFHMKHGNLRVVLPSGRAIVYREARVEDRQFFSRIVKAVTFRSARFGRVTMYGGKWAENVVQGTARDVQMSGFVNCETRDMPVCVRNHDELVGAIPECRFGDFMAAITEPPPWLTGFPLDAEGCLAPRYAKSPPPGVTETVYRNGRPHK